MRYLKAIPLILLIVFSLSSCSVFDGLKPYKPIEEPLTESEIIPEGQADKVVMNLVHTLAQLPELHPLQTTVQIGEITTSLGDILKTRLREAGYGTQFVTSDIGDNYLKYKYENSITNEGPVIKFSISIGEITVERVYLNEKNTLIPDSPIMVIGTTANGMVANDGIYGDFRKTPMYSSETIFTETEVPEVIVMASGFDSPPELSGFAASIRRNMHDIGDSSNYEQLFAEYTTVKNSVLIFENDKMNLGVNNKRIIQDLAKLHNPETDIISVVGCSHGKTKIKNGNEILALGRANRVKEAFLFANVSSEKILEEGCWHNVHHDELPRRGVVVQLKRKKT